ncbi:MAG: signal recognition particle-docking protein FtsY [Chlamydiia bacterium]|nr:signal recognition particle-docking protein FtsY [Chlamydiia bacterium]
MGKKFFKKKGAQIRSLGLKIRALLAKKVDPEVIEQLERLFFEADLGAEMSMMLSEKVEKLYRKNPQISIDEVLEKVRRFLLDELESIPRHSREMSFPHVILIVGVNGNGKTTSIAKLAKHYVDQNKKVLVAACDTFRAAATEQLEKWCHQLGCDLVKGADGSDPAAVVFDAITAAKSRDTDIVLVDTAGRLHTKTELMRELEKIKRVSGKAASGAPHETLLVLDATIGQNGIDQALIFHQFTPLDGLILTKVDGTAKGGTAFSIQKKLRIPIQFLGTGESLEDLSSFEPKEFIHSLI